MKMEKQHFLKYIIIVQTKADRNTTEDGINKPVQSPSQHSALFIAFLKHS